MEIVVTDLVKHYKVHHRPPGLLAALGALFKRQHMMVPAVDGISFKIGAGERVGFLGPNGAGKTTTLKVLVGLLYPTAGRVNIGGFIPQRRDYDFLRQIAMVTGFRMQLLWDLPPVDTFELNRVIYQVSRADYRRRLDELVEDLQLAPLMQKPTRQLSHGERIKCEITAALLHQPQLLFFDEPTIGLDVTMQTVVRRFLKSYTERYGATMVLTSHYMADVLALCPRLVVINHGRLSYDGSPEELVRLTRPERRLVLHLRQPVAPAELAELGRVVEHTDAQVTVQVVGAQLKEIITAALTRLPIDDLSVEDPPLEEALSDLFMRGVQAPST